MSTEKTREAMKEQKSKKQTKLDCFRESNPGCWLTKQSSARTQLMKQSSERNRNWAGPNAPGGCATVVLLRPGREIDAPWASSPLAMPQTVRPHSS